MRQAAVSLAFRGVTVFDGERFLDEHTVVVVDGRVAAVGPAGTVPVPAGARTFEGGGRALLPGFVDAHVHMGLVDPRAVLRGGVTAARDLGWPADPIFRLTARLAADPTAGPLLLAAGPMLTAPGGYPSRAGWGPRATAREVAGLAEARAAVREVVERGAGVVKVAQEPRGGPTMPAVVLRAVVEEAHASGVRVTSHVGSLEQLELALDAGVDELAHGLWSDEPIPDTLVRRMVAAGVVVVPTVHVDPSPARIESLRAFAGAGGRVVYGTDMGNAGPPQGVDVQELRLMMAAGLSLEAALAAATSRAADHLGLAGRGRVTAGAPADLLLAGGDPRRDLEALGRPVVTLRDGWPAR